MSNFGDKDKADDPFPRAAHQGLVPETPRTDPDWLDPNIEHPANRPDPLATPPHAPSDATARVVTGVEQSVHAGGPSNWWRLGLLLLAVLVLVLLVMQVMSGGQVSTSG